MGVRRLSRGQPEALRIPVTILGQSLRQCAAPVDLTPAQAGVLSQLTAAPMSITALAHSQGFAISTMTEIVGRMCDRGYVTKGPAEDDRRRAEVAITEKGHACLAEVLAARDALLRKRLGRLSPSDLDRLRDAVDVLWQVADLDMAAWPRFAPASVTPTDKDVHVH